MQAEDKTESQNYRAMQSKRKDYRFLRDGERKRENKNTHRLSSRAPQHTEVKELRRGTLDCIDGRDILKATQKGRQLRSVHITQWSHTQP